MTSSKPTIAALIGQIHPSKVVPSTTSNFALFRSSRSIESLCGDSPLKDFNQAETVLVISLAYLSGWSAERISQTIAAKASKEVSPEEVWSYVQGWVSSYSKNGISKANRKLMEATIGDSGLEVEIGKQEIVPLFLTKKPVTVDFIKIWQSPLEALCNGYTAGAREVSKAYLEDKPLREYGRLTPTEEPIIAKFGHTLIQTVLHQWCREFEQLLDQSHPLRPIARHENHKLTTRYVDTCRRDWEMEFGTMAFREELSKEGAVETPNLPIHSTGYGCMVLFAVMLYDRSGVINDLKKRTRERVGFEVVPVGDLEEGCKNCCICKEPLYVETPEGTSERALRLVICCGCTIGEKCLKTWLINGVAGGGLINKTCPMCRHEFTNTLMVNLFGGRPPARDARPNAPNDRGPRDAGIEVIRWGEDARARRLDRNRTPWERDRRRFLNYVAAPDDGPQNLDGVRGGYLRRGDDFNNAG